MKLAGLVTTAALVVATVPALAQGTGQTAQGATRYSIDGRLASLWQQHQGSAGPFNIDLERMTLKNVTRDELVELCSVQYYLLLEKVPEHA